VKSLVHLHGRLHELSLVDVDTLVGRLEGEAARQLLGAFVADLEEAVGQARAALRAGQLEMTSGLDPLLLLEHASERRAQIGEPGFREADTRLAARATARRELASLEELVRLVLPRLLEADRRLQST
jgi:hypothetical protein